jgi:hypothetical protein
MKRARNFIPVLVFFFLAAEAAAKPIVFPDFPWGSRSCDVEITAGGKGWRLLDKTLDPDRRELVYRTVFEERECKIVFRFTPAGDKLFSVRAEWEGSGFGYVLLEKYQKIYRTPREEMPRMKTYIWSRQNTEIELRHDDESTILIYSDLTLWSEYTEEMKRLKELRKEKDSDQ